MFFNFNFFTASTPEYLFFFVVVKLYPLHNNKKKIYLLVFLLRGENFVVFSVYISVILLSYFFFLHIL